MATIPVKALGIDSRLLHQLIKSVRDAADLSGITITAKMNERFAAIGAALDEEEKETSKAGQRIRRASKLAKLKTMLDEPEFEKAVDALLLSANGNN